MSVLTDDRNTQMRMPESPPAPDAEIYGRAHYDIVFAFINTMRAFDYAKPITILRPADDGSVVRTTYYVESTPEEAEAKRVQNGWLPIECAPKGDPGPEIVCFRAGAEETLHWRVLRDVVNDVERVMGGWWFNGDTIIRDNEPQPTHWKHKEQAS